MAVLAAVLAVMTFASGALYAHLLKTDQTLSEFLRAADDNLEGLAGRLGNWFNLILTKLVGNKGGEGPLMPDIGDLGYPEKFPTLVINFDKVICKMEHNKLNGWRVVRRPGANRLFRELMSHYELIVWSDDVFPVAQDVTTAWGLPIAACLHRDQCEKRKAVWVKDIRRLGRRLDRTIIVDCDANAFGDNRENGIVIPEFHGDPTDRTLDKLVDFLKAAALSPTEDLRSTIDKFGGGLDGQLPTRYEKHQEEASKKRAALRSVGQAIGINSMVEKSIHPSETTDSAFKSDPA